MHKIKTLCVYGADGNWIRLEYGTYFEGITIDSITYLDTDKILIRGFDKENRPISMHIKDYIYHTNY